MLALRMRSAPTTDAILGTSRARACPARCIEAGLVCSSDILGEQETRSNVLYCYLIIVSHCTSTLQLQRSVAREFNPKHHWKQPRHRGSKALLWLLTCSRYVVEQLRCKNRPRGVQAGGCQHGVQCRTLDVHEAVSPPLRGQHAIMARHAGGANNTKLHCGAALLQQVFDLRSWWFQPHKPGRSNERERLQTKAYAQPFS